MGAMAIFGVILILAGVVLNNLVYLQDLWLGQSVITLDSWRAYIGIFVAILMVAAGILLMIQGLVRRMR